MDIKVNNLTNRKNYFITYVISNRLKYIIYAKDLKFDNSSIFYSNYYLQGVALCYLAIDSKCTKKFVYGETNFVLNAHKAIESSEEEIRELYKHLKYDYRGI